MINITIQSVTNADYFKIKKYPSEFFDSKPKAFELVRGTSYSVDNEKITVSAKNVNSGEYIFTNVPVDEIEVDGAAYSAYEDLSEVLTPLLFKKGGGSGGGGTGGAVSTQSPITGDGDTTPINIVPASSGSRGTMSSSDFNKLAGFNNASNYALKTDITDLDSSIKLWVNNKNYVTIADVGSAFYNKVEIDGKLSSTYKAKGNVANFAALPTSNRQFGDVWNLLDSGDNYVWIEDYNNTGNPGWDKLSGIVDLSNYYTSTQVEDAIINKGYATTVSVNLALASKENLIITGTTSQYYRGDKTWQTLNKSAVGLGNIDNTSDVNKPVSTAQAIADALKLDKPTTAVSVSDTTYNRVPWIDSVGNTKYFTTSGIGERVFTVSATGQPRTDYIVVDQIVEDLDIISALTSATYTNGMAMISPAGGKVFEKGLIYFDSVGGYIYYAFLNNNAMRFKSA